MADNNFSIKLGMTDIRAVLEVINEAVADWPQERRAELRAALDIAIRQPGGVEIDTSSTPAEALIGPPVFIVLRDFGIGDMPDLPLVCPKCNGAGHYFYDEIHATPCEVCCKHDHGWWRQTDNFPQPGRLTCRRGCGATKDG